MSSDGASVLSLAIAEELRAVVRSLIPASGAHACAAIANGVAVSLAVSQRSPYPAFANEVKLLASDLVAQSSLSLTR